MSEEVKGRYIKENYAFDEVRPLFVAAIKDRARYLAFFYKVMPRDLFDKYAKEAMFEYGKYKNVMRLYKGENGDVKDFAKFMISDAIANVAATCDGDHYAVETGDDKCVVRFAGKCALVEGWEDMGLTPEEVEYLCEIACYGDYGYTDVLDLKGSFNCTSAQPGCEYCEFVIEKKK